MTDTPKHPTDCTCAGPDEHTPGCGVHHEQHVDVFQRLAACASTWMPSACVFGNVRADEIAAACEWAIDRATHRAAVVADSPELAQALRERDVLSATVAELEAERGAMVTEVAYRISERDAARTELAQARERIAALEDERVHVKQVADTWQAVTDGLNARIVALKAKQKADAEACAKATWTAVVLVTERDAALARVRELEARALVLRDHAEDVRRDAVQLLDGQKEKDG